MVINTNNTSRGRQNETTVTIYLSNELLLLFAIVIGQLSLILYYMICVCNTPYSRTSYDIWWASDWSR